jgi:hypothetical protein
MKDRICIRCGGKLKRGKAVVRGNSLGFLARGWSWSFLFFVPGGDTRREWKALKQGRGVEAFECSRCGALEITRNAHV